MEPGRVLDLDRRRERSGKQAGKIRRVFSGVFRGAVRGGGQLQHTGRQEARADKSTGGRLQVNRKTAGPAAHDRTGGGLWHRAGERAKTGRQGDGQPHREGFYAPGIVSWELDIYAPHSPPTGRKLTASTSTGKEQGNSLEYHTTGINPLLILPGEEGILYLVFEKGIYRHVIGGNLIEQVVDGALPNEREALLAYICRSGPGGPKEPPPV